MFKFRDTSGDDSNPMPFFIDNFSYLFQLVSEESSIIQILILLTSNYSYASKISEYIESNQQSLVDLFKYIEKKPGKEISEFVFRLVNMNQHISIVLKPLILTILYKIPIDVSLQFFAIFPDFSHKNHFTMICEWLKSQQEISVDLSSLFIF